jgi:hypothetical protein
MMNEFALNLDFTKTACIRPKPEDWVKSPSDGVSRLHLERENEESGHTTSLVQFAPGSSFPC